MVVALAVSVYDGCAGRSGVAFVCCLGVGKVGGWCGVAGAHAERAIHDDGQKWLMG